MSARTIVFPSEPFEELRTGALQGVPTCKAARMKVFFVRAIEDSPGMNMSEKRHRGDRETRPVQV
jgi:hypothetical protein